MPQVCSDPSDNANLSQFLHRERTLWAVFLIVWMREDAGLWTRFGRTILWLVHDKMYVDCVVFENVSRHRHWYLVCWCQHMTVISGFFDSLWIFFWLLFYFETIFQVCDDDFTSCPNAFLIFFLTSFYELGNITDDATQRILGFIFES